MKIVKATMARNNFQDIIDEVPYKKEPIIITKRNKPWAIINALPEDNKK
jgi:prevent-host-death family protein